MFVPSANLKLVSMKEVMAGVGVLAFPWVM